MILNYNQIIAKKGKTSTTSAEQGTDVQDNDVGPVASTESTQTEEQPSSFFGSLFSILIRGCPETSKFKHIPSLT
ncbi:MAG: hypothetical protein WBIAU1_06190 [Wolbachia endosymbiont of Drosophila biauraria]|nr:MAG: hypothetical protein WBIAU1_06190 [Wolbachia endosymbiont of Drosophila biauraria]